MWRGACGIGYRLFFCDKGEVFVVITYFVTEGVNLFYYLWLKAAGNNPEIISAPDSHFVFNYCCYQRVPWSFVYIMTKYYYPFGRICQKISVGLEGVSDLPQVVKKGFVCG
ncbi:MAG: hypothetical protein IH591_01935 [Bacteroidales bacterium]|nr:hypothetical protein [Bacteroidales bacterium]